VTHDKSRCADTNAKTGNPCRAWPLRGTDRCLAHTDQVSRGSTRFGGPQPGGGRPRKPRVVDVLREQVEDRAEEVLAPLWDGLTAERAIVVGSGESAELQAAPDMPTRLAAARELLDRAYGRPMQATEVSGPDGGPVQILDALSPDGRKAMRDVLARRAPARDR
jgi:hypothetical protein